MNYRIMARHLGVEDEGWVQSWLDRRWTRRGAREFLTSHEYMLDENWEPSVPEWYRLWATDRAARMIARSLGFHLPLRSGDEDRARARRLAAEEGVHLARDYPHIYRWARRVK